MEMKYSQLKVFVYELAIILKLFYEFFYDRVINDIKLHLS